MSNDELLDRIAQEGLKPYGNIMNTNLVLALRAVVELHKPVQGSSDITTYDYIGCDSCVEWSHDGNMNLRYPCPTIQAIEGQLK